MATRDFVGPLSFTVFHLPLHADLAPVAQEISQLVERQAIELLDIEVIGAHGGAHREELTRVYPALAGIAGAETDLLDGEDLESIAEELTADERALVVVYEDRALASLATRISTLGGREAWSGGVDAAGLEEQYETEPEDEGGDRAAAPAIDEAAR